MDILRFINSKDIREHLRNINYEFNSLEAAWLIYQCKTATIEEKHAAWQELIDTMPDCKIKERMNTEPQESLHQYLSSYIDCEENLFDEFFTQTNGWIYTLDIHTLDDEEATWFTVNRLYNTFEAIQKVLGKYKDCQENFRYRITKQKIESRQRITVYFDLNDKPYNYDMHEYPESFTNILYGVFDGLWFEFPTPFKKGDILCEYDADGKESGGFCQGPFVMTGITPEYATEHTRPYGDETDMNAWGYFQHENGMIYDESMWNYMDLEYYRGELNGKRRILKALSNHVKGNIDTALFANAYHHILCDERAKAQRPRGYTDEGLRLAGLLK